MSNEHQPGSPGAVDLDELENEGHEWDHGQLLRAARSLAAELRTLRARVGELEDRIQKRVLSTDHEKKFSVLTATAEYWNAKATAHHARAESAEARVAALEKLFDDAGQGEHNVLALIDHYQSEAMAESEARRAALARVGELECAEADLESQLAEHKSQFANAVEVIRHADRRVVDLESQIAAAREEAKAAFSDGLRSAQELAKQKAWGRMGEGVDWADFDEAIDSASAKGRS